MKRLLTILCLVLLSSCSQPDIPSHRLVQNGGLTYEVGSNNPYTGVSSTFDQDGQLERKKEYENGIELSDTIFGYHENGQLAFRGNLVDGKPEGLAETFRVNGQLQGRENYKNGKEDGLWEEFDEDGNLTRTQTFRNGELVEENDNP